MREFERLKGVSLPDDLRRFLLAVNGMDRRIRRGKDGRLRLGKDAEGFAFWNLGELARVDFLQSRTPSLAGPENSKEFYAFADYMDWSWAYAISLCGDDRNSIVLIGGDGIVPRVARSFTEFLELCLVDSPLLYPPR